MGLPWSDSELRFCERKQLRLSGQRLFATNCKSRRKRGLTGCTPFFSKKRGTTRQTPFFVPLLTPSNIKKTSETPVGFFCYPHRRREMRYANSKRIDCSIVRPDIGVHFRPHARACEGDCCTGRRSPWKPGSSD